MCTYPHQEKERKKLSKFSRYGSFHRWKKNTTGSSQYIKRVEKLRQLFPDLPLKKLVKKRIKDADLSLKSWNELTPTQKETRKRALRVIDNMRSEGESFTAALKQNEVDKMIIKRHLGNSLFKRNRRYKIKALDNIQRGMHFYEDGVVRDIIVTNSIDASLIGKYFSAVRHAIRTGDTSQLTPFVGKSIVDASGSLRTFETDIEKLFEIEERKEHPEFFEIYLR